MPQSTEAGSGEDCVVHYCQERCGWGLSRIGWWVIKWACIIVFAVFIVPPLLVLALYWIVKLLLLFGWALLGIGLLIFIPYALISAWTDD